MPKFYPSAPSMAERVTADGTFVLVYATAAVLAGVQRPQATCGASARALVQQQGLQVCMCAYARARNWEQPAFLSMRCWPPARVPRR